MNCFHFWVSLGYNTTNGILSNWFSWLWIAFIFEYLWDTTQLLLISFYTKISCELLSFLSIFGIQHNSLRLWLYASSVVNCFHFWVSLGYNTTTNYLTLQITLLWIAFIFEYLWDTTQLPAKSFVILDRCELLSFLSIFGIQHNIRIELKIW